jgi:chloramphenicol-sensitive protein RarD
VIITSEAPPSATPVTTAPAALDPRGLGLGLSGYLMWGTLPLFFKLLERSSPIEVVAHRAVWSLLFCLLLLVVMRQLPSLLTVLRNRRAVGALALSAMLVAVNWVLFVWGVTNGHVVEASLGYFINPIVTVVIAVLVLRERLSRGQWMAVAIAGTAVGVLTVAAGGVPWLALGLAGSFGLYGLVKNRVGRTVGALPGLAVETMVLTPVGIAYLVWLGPDGTMLGSGPGYAALLVSTGVVTALPLLLFSAAARSLPLSVVGLMQYITPLMQFLVGVLVFGEHMAPARWAGFVLVWIAIGVLSVDAVRNLRRRALLRAPVTA